MVLRGRGSGVRDEGFVQRGDGLGVRAKGYSKG